MTYGEFSWRQEIRRNVPLNGPLENIMSGTHSGRARDVRQTALYRNRNAYRMAAVVRNERKPYYGLSFTRGGRRLSVFGCSWLSQERRLRVTKFLPTPAIGRV